MSSDISVGGRLPGPPDPSTQPDPAPPETLPARVPPEQLASLTSRATVSQQSVEELNRQFAADPVLGLRVVRTLVDDPSSWDQLFTLDDEHRAALSVQQRSRTAPMSRLVGKTAVFAEDLSQVTIVISTPDSGIPVAESETDPWFVPDKLEVKGEADTDGKVKVSATLTWTF